MAVDWNTSMVAVISPDAFLRGVGSQIVDEVLAADCTEVTSRVVRPGQLTLDAIYEDLASQNISFGTYRYRAIDALFGLGSSLAILVTANDPQIHDRFGRLKGSGPLEKAAPDSIRRRYHSINTILSLLHTSSHAQESEVDWHTFFPRDWLNLGAQWLPLEPYDIPTPGARELAALLDQTEAGRERRGFTEVRAGLRRTLLAHYWELLPVAQADKVAEELRTGDGSLLESPAFLHSVADSMLDRVDLVVRQALVSSFTPEDAPLDTKRLWQLLAGTGIFLDPWTKVVLSTSQFFPPTL